MNHVENKDCKPPTPETDATKRQKKCNTSPEVLRRGSCVKIASQHIGSFSSTIVKEVLVHIKTKVAISI